MESYQDFFKKALVKFKVGSPEDFKSDEEKKKFYDYIDKNWKAEDETDESTIKEMVKTLPSENIVSKLT